MLCDFCILDCCSVIFVCNWAHAEALTTAQQRCRLALAPSSPRRFDALYTLLSYVANSTSLHSIPCQQTIRDQHLGIRTTCILPPRRSHALLDGTLDEAGHWPRMWSTCARKMLCLHARPSRKESGNYILEPFLHTTPYHATPPFLVLLPHIRSPLPRHE